MLDIKQYLKLIRKVFKDFVDEPMLKVLDNESLSSKRFVAFYQPSVLHIDFN